MSYEDHKQAGVRLDAMRKELRDMLREYPEESRVHQRVRGTMDSLNALRAALAHEAMSLPELDKESALGCYYSVSGQGAG